MKAQWSLKVLSAIMIVMLALAALPVTPVRAATFTVTKTNDTNDGTCNADCSLREAIVAANAAAGADTIVLNSGSTYTLSIAGADNTSAAGDLDIATGGLTINTNGAGGATIDANDIDRIFHVLAGANLSLNNVTVTDGTNTIGGGMIVEGTATINGGAFTSNTATGTGTNNGGAIYATGTLTIGNTSGVTFTSNIASDNGGAIYHDSATALAISSSTFTTNSAAGGDGGAINTNNGGSSLTITNSTFDGNTAGDDGGAIRNVSEPTNITGSIFTNNSISSVIGDVAMGGAIWNEGIADATTIRMSTFTNNTVTHTTTNDNDALGGAIANDGSTFILANVTFNSNTASYTGGSNNDAFGGAVYTSATSTIHNVTFSGNTASESGSGAASGGNIYRSGGTVTLANTIVTGGTPNNCGGTITNGGNNIDSAATCGWGANLLSMSNTNPNLGAITGSPAYFPLNAGSPAINAGSNSICSTSTSTNNQSQNGLTRPQGTNCEIGSYEMLGLITTTTNITADTPDPSVTGQSVAVSVTVTGGATPTGTVDITGADVNCSITLDINGEGSCNVTFNSTGNKTLTANYLGDATHDPSVDTEAHVVNQATTTTTITADPTDPSVVGQAYSVSASAVINAPGAGTLTGTITVSDGSQTCTITLPAASCNLTSTTAGTKSLIATYNGNANFAASASVAEPHQVNQAATTTTITADTPDPSLVGQSYSVTASAAVNAPGAGTLTGTITVTDGTVNCVITLPATSCNLTSTTAGAKTLTATYSGNANFAGSTSAGVPHQVNEAPDMEVQGNGITITDGDTTPNTADNTNFGNVPENFFVEKTFTINNTGAGSLTLGAITFTGANPGDFSVVTAPTSPVPPGGNTTFTVRLTANNAGNRSATINIANNDPDEGPYNFLLQGTGVNAEISVEGGFPLTNIPDDLIVLFVSSSNCTLFPSASFPGGHSDCTYTITNQSATIPLSIGTVSITGADAADFTVLTPPASTVAPGGTTTFTVRFTPSRITTILNPENATVNFDNNDSNEHPFNFAIAGQGTPNTPPTTSGIAPVTVLEDAANTSIDLFPSFADAESMDSQLTYTITGNTNAGLFTAVTPPALGGQFLILNYAPDANGTANITVRATDPGGLFVETIFTVNVTAVNDEPDFTATNPPTVDEDAGAQSIAGWVTSVDFGPADEDGSQSVLAYVVTNSSCGTLLTAAPTVNPAGTLSFTPALNRNGSCTFDLQVQDNGGTANNGDDTGPVHTFTITVGAINDEPDFAASNPPAVNEDAGAQTINNWAVEDLGPADEDANQNVLGYNISNNTCGTLLSAGPAVSLTGTLTYTPAINQNGTCTFDVQVQDDGGTLNAGDDDTGPIHSFTITVNTVNDEPNFTASNPPAVNEDSGLQTINNWAVADMGPADEDVSQTVLGYIVTNSSCGTLLTAAPAISATGTLTYTPAINQNGTCTFDVQVQDDGGIANGGDDTSPVQTFTITVGNINDEPNFTASNPPAVNEDAGLQTINNWAIADLGPADEDVSQTVLAYNVTNSSCGTLLTADPAISTTGTLTYTPVANQNGTCTFDVQVQDNGGTANGGDDTSPVQTFTITVGAVNDEPDFTAANPPAVSEDAGLQTIAGWVTSFDLGPADEDVSQTVLGYIVSNDTCGTLLTAAPTVSPTGTLTYTPAVNQNGTCTFDVQVQDDGGTANGGDDRGPIHTFTINVGGVNDAPVCVNVTILTNEDTTGTTLPSCSDLDGDTLTYSVVGAATNGTGSFVTPNLSYAPNLNFNGTDSFTYRANDGTTDSNTATVNVTVTPVNDAPVCNNVFLNTVEDTTGTTAPDCNDVDGDTLTYSTVGAATNGTGSFVDPNLTYTPNLDYNGPDSFTYRANDGTVNSNTATVTVSVNASNDAPVCTNVNINTLEDTTGTTLPNCIDPDGNPLTYTIIGAATNGTGSFVNPNLSYSPNANYHGTDSFTYRASDGIANSNIATVNVNIASVNDVPVCNNVNITTNEDNTGIVPPDCNDADLDPLTYSVVGAAINGTGSFINPNLSYAPNANYNGGDGFTYRANDGTVNSNTANVFVTVNPVNDAPSFVKGPDQAANEDAGAQSVAGWATLISAGPLNEAGQTVSFNATNNNNALFSAQPAVSPTGTLTYTPAPNANGAATVTLTISDNGGTANGGVNTSASQTFVITINPVNDLPVAVNDNATTNEDSAATPINVLGNDNDVENDPITITGVTQPANGTVINNGTNVTYQPNINYCNTSLPADTFTYTINGGSTATVSVTVTCGDDAPVAVDDTATTAEDTNVTIPVLANDTDLDGGLKQVAIVGTTPNGTVINNTTNVTYQPDANYCNSGSAPDSFDYTLNGGSSATVFVTVTCVDDAPVAVDDNITVPGAISSTLDVLTNDTDVDGGPKQVASVTAAANGTVTNNTTNISYVPDPAYCGPDTFDYTLNGGATATVTLDVVCSPAFTSADNTAFDLGFSGTFNITAIGNPATMTITMTGAPAGVTLTDNGDGTATLDGDGSTPVGVYNLIFTADNGVTPNGIQNFTLTVRNGPILTKVNSLPDTGDGFIIENENISTELGITQIIVEFNRDVYDDPTDTTNFDDDVTNPANYILVRSVNGTFATTSCDTGVKTPDIKINVNSVSYTNGGGSGPYVATLAINDSLPLNVEAFYKLFVCGTTSIVDATNTGLTLAGDGVNPGTDFVRNFRITAPATGNPSDDDGSANAARNKAIAATISQGGFLIPVTGFTPQHVTMLPAQTTEYASSKLTLEIPSISLKMPIVGVEFQNNTWDVTWLGNSTGYLEGSAYPTTVGNTVLTGHVTDPNGKPGPFAYLTALQLGEKIYIRNDGFIYVYDVRSTSLIQPTAIKTLFKHTDDSWVSIVTCENFDKETGEFKQRRLIRAVLISIIPVK